MRSCTFLVLVATECSCRVAGNKCILPRREFPHSACSVGESGSDEVKSFFIMSPSVLRLGSSAVI